MTLIDVLKTLSVSALAAGLFACSNNSSTLNNHANTPAKEASYLKVVTPDWGIAAELTGMGHPPIATGEIRIYEDWSGQLLHPSTHDFGIRFQPNPEMMAQLKPDLVIDNKFYQHIRPMYGDVPIRSLLFRSYTNKDTDEKRAIWQDFANLTLELGDMINQPKDAKAYVAKSEKELQQLGKVFNKKYPQIKKLAIVQFSDVANQRMYTKNSIYQPTLEKMGLELVAFDYGNEWGFASAQLGDLDKLGRNPNGKINHDTCLIIVKPFSHMLQDELNNSILWQKMGFGKASIHHLNGRCMAVIQPVWMYGGIASMTSFAKKLVHTELYGGSIIKPDNSNLHKKTTDTMQLQDESANHNKQSSEQLKKDKTGRE